MKSYRKHSASFYVLDAAAHGGDFPALWRDLQFSPTEDIVIVSLKNDSRRGNHLRNAIKAKLEQRAGRRGEHIPCGVQDQYELVDPNFQFEGNSFILMVRGELRSDIGQVHCKSVQLRLRRRYGKRYSRVMRHCFDHFMMCTRPLGGGTPGQAGQLPAKRMIQRRGASQARARPPRRHPRCRSEGASGCAKVQAEGGTEGRGRRHDENVVTCVTFTFKGVSLCVCLANFDLDRHVERAEYYRCLLGGGEGRGSDKSKHRRDGNVHLTTSTQRDCRPAATGSNYAEAFLQNYRLCCMQMYNHFANNIAFETDKEDLHMLSMDVVVLQGFDQSVLFNHSGEGSLQNDSLIWGNNVTILNKSEKNVLKKRSYFTLTCSGKNDELVSFGFKICCELFSQVEVSIVGDFFLPHGGEAKWGAENAHIGVKPEVLELGCVYTYQVCQASFLLEYANPGGGGGEVCERGGPFKGLGDGQPHEGRHFKWSAGVPPDEGRHFNWSAGVPQDELKHLKWSADAPPAARGELSFSILCFDPKSQTTIPIHLYSFLHLKKNSIFKHLEENVRFGRSQASGKRKECRPAPAEQENHVDMVRHIYVHPHKGVVRPNEKKKIHLNVYVDHMLKGDGIVKGCFILIIRIHKCGRDVKQIFFTCRYSLGENLVGALLRDEHPWGGARCGKRPPVERRRSGPRTTARVKTNISLHRRSSRNGLQNCKMREQLGGAKGRPYLPVNITKFVLFCFFAIDQYERELLNRVGTLPEGVSSQEADQPLYPLGLSNLRTDHLVYCFSPTSSSLQGVDSNGIQPHFNYSWRKHYFCAQYPQQKYVNEKIFAQNGSRQRDVPLEVHYLVGQLQSNGKVERPICVAAILLLWEELFRVLTPPFGTFARVTQMVRRIYANSKLRHNRKMHFIFRAILGNSPSVLHKNVFLVLLSFLKKLFCYFACVCLRGLGVSRGEVGGGPFSEMSGVSLGEIGGDPLRKMNGGPFGAPAQAGPPPFPLFLRAFHFLHLSFLSYVSTFFLSFLDHQIGLDLAHYLLFHV
ncbi:unnamed protein product [Plasmodium vivax]|uniref:(malaria parasite P. vivax) hypothetical protein n=1 Tax=Plasmodium vivax TaxID=5855 RepID=A0A8S4H7R5_PLAVI|nr:unnamed protein product [Plasmodium vivax]